MNRDECPDMFLELLVIGMVVTVEYENELRNRLEPAQFSLILSRQALGYALQGITIVNLYDVGRHARCADNDIRKRVGSAELNFLLDAHRLGSTPSCETCMKRQMLHASSSMNKRNSTISRRCMVSPLDIDRDHSPLTV